MKELLEIVGVIFLVLALFASPFILAGAGLGVAGYTFCLFVGFC